MADKREAILARLQVIAKAVRGVVSAVRNMHGLSDTQRPAIVVLDGDEAADDGDPRNRPTNAYRIVDMTPEIYILLGAAPEDVGADINLLRARLVKAILTDTTLRELTFQDEGIRYEGCVTALASGRTMEGEMAVNFTFTYVLRATDL